MDLHKETGNDDQRLTAAVQEYFHLHFEGLYRYAFSILKNNDDSRDAVQSVFLKFWEKRAAVDKNRSVQSYLYTSVYHHCLNVKRNEKVRREYIKNNQQAQYTNNNKLLTKEGLKTIADALDALPPQCKSIFLKSRFEKKKYAEIAEELDLSVKTVEAQVGKALKILREKLLRGQVLFIVILMLL